MSYNQQSANERYVHAVMHLFVVDGSAEFFLLIKQSRKRSQFWQKEKIRRKEEKYVIF